MAITTQTSVKIKVTK